MQKRGEDISNAEFIEAKEPSTTNNEPPSVANTTATEVSTTKVSTTDEASTYGDIAATGPSNSDSISVRAS